MLCIQRTENLNKRGYYAVVSKGYEETIEHITNYLNEKI